MSSHRRLDTNVPGPLFVTSACIDCDTCRQLAPRIFTEAKGFSTVAQQPETGLEQKQALQAMLSCPTAAIVSEEKRDIAEAMADFPLLLEDGVHYCGYTSPKSFGGSSYFILRPKGNWLIDAPRFVPSLARRFEEMGGIDTIFLTHRDDVADAKLYAERFGAKRIIHAIEREAQPDAEHVIEGFEDVQWDNEMKIVVVPGHTRGSMVLLYQERFLFTGDHLAWDRHRGALEAFEDYCWYSWEEQGLSMERLAAETFEWVLPGHGERVKQPPEDMKKAMQRLVNEMRGR
ncbi:MBL fold metallo-hydrolase [Paenibacillus sp. Soil787]|uniref:MBL fold metallo-hydrolase n=1 Tax=Paenibacillus sp. Soil787 TaxID=1736411 RepID=UPI0006FCBFB0|nr:MBL fold metallo-hydrolase [Paenibacillus sp. Soil787]KRF34607.1 MBL fold metallo-hydrolase [Paenibacillus sp. Soil787]